MRCSPSLVEQGVVAGNVYDKYGTHNPIARWLMQGFLDALAGLLARTGAERAHEVGCGEGRLSVFLARRLRQVRGSDFSSQVIAQAREEARRAGAEITFKVASLYDLRPEVDAEELIVCCEVLEHLAEPERALEVLAGLARPHLIVSVPREPLWRLLNLARGKYLGALGNTPGHLQHWSAATFVSFLGHRFEVVEVRTPLPWTMALCRTRATG
jgi:2-polyprenyl-3-methyl-5-hydroxy-6-metoxy-1,4-benzoquinol methylase